MTDTINKNVEDALDDIFASSKAFDSIEVELPSKAKGYKRTKNIVTIRAMTFEDEKHIATYNGDSLIDSLIERCIDKVDIDELYLEDKLFLYYKLRECSFGSLAKITAICNSCNVENDLEIDLSKLSINYAKDDFTDPKEVFLPNLNKKVMVNKVRAYHQEYTSTPDKLLNNLWRFVVKIGEHKDPVVLSKAVKRFSSADLRILMKSINSTDFGLDTRAKYSCNKCNSKNVAVVGLTLDFFMMS